MNEHEAIRRLKRGDIKGLETIVQTYQVEAIRTANMILRDPMRAEDIVQEAFLRVYSRIKSFDEKRPLRPWIMKIVVNEAYRAAAPERDLSLHQPIQNGNLPIEDVVADDSPLLPDVYAQREIKAHIWESLGKLSAAERTLITLRYYLDYSEREIAEVLDCPLGTAKWRLHKARKNLKKHMETILKLNEA